MLTVLQWTNTTSVISKWCTFSTFLFLVILHLVLPNNLIVSGVKSSRSYPIFILNVILFENFFTYILLGGFLVTVSCFLMIYSKWSWISDKEYNSSGNSNFSFRVGAGNLNLLFLYNFFYVFPRVVNGRIWQTTYLSFLFNFILSGRLSSLRLSKVMSMRNRCFTTFRIHKYSIHSVL